MKRRKTPGRSRLTQDQVHDRNLDIVQDLKTMDFKAISKKYQISIQTVRKVDREERERTRGLISRAGELAHSGIITHHVAPVLDSEKKLAILSDDSIDIFDLSLRIDGVTYKVENAIARRER